MKHKQAAHILKTRYLETWLAVLDRQAHHQPIEIAS